MILLDSLTCDKGVERNNALNDETPIDFDTEDFETSTPAKTSNYDKDGKRADNSRENSTPQYARKFSPGKHKIEHQAVDYESSLVINVTNKELQLDENLDILCSKNVLLLVAYILHTRRLVLNFNAIAIFRTPHHVRQRLL